MFEYGTYKQILANIVVQTQLRKKKPSDCSLGFSNLINPNQTYLFITYIVTSKPKRISVAAGVVHMIISFFNVLTTICRVRMLHIVHRFKKLTLCTVRKFA